jgi:hypothetical protein
MNMKQAGVMFDRWPLVLDLVEAFIMNMKQAGVIYI